MKLLKVKINVLITFFVIVCLTNCTTVKPYQKAYLNDSNMDLGDSTIDEFSTTFQSYREGAVGGNNGNKGNGCGCN